MEQASVEGIISSAHARWYHSRTISIAKEGSKHFRNSLPIPGVMVWDPREIY